MAEDLLTFHQFLVFTQNSDFALYGKEQFMILEILFIIVFALFLIMLVSTGFFSFFFPHKAIDFNLKVANRINFLGVTPPVDPHGPIMVGYYKMVGFAMLIVVGCPLLLIITLTIKVIIGGGEGCIGENCIKF